MKVLTVSDFRKNLAEILNCVVDDAEEVILPREGRQAVVIIPLEQWESMRETFHVLGDADSARELLRRTADLEAGGGQEHELPDLDQVDTEPAAATVAA